MSTSPTAARAASDERPAGGLGALLASGAPVAILFWGSSFVATRIALESFDPFGVVAGRFVLGAAAVLLLLVSRREPLLPAAADRPRCALLGAILAAHMLIQGFAMRLSTAISAGWIVAFTPAVIALGATVFLRERIGGRGWLGLALATCGVAVVASGRPVGFADAGWGDLMMVSSCLTWTAYTLLGRRPVARSGALATTHLALLVAAGIALAAALLREHAGGLAAWSAGHARGWLAVAFLGVLCSGVALTLWLRAVERLGAAATGSVLYFQPFVTLVAALLVLDEPLTVQALVGGPIVLAGVALVRR